MTLKLATWNINSVRLRQDLIARLVDVAQPDILCLQEIKCANDQFPQLAMRALGFEHVLVHGQRGYHGIATLSRLPIEPVGSADHNGSGEARHLAVKVRPPGSRAGFVLHNFYVPAGGDVPDVNANPKFRQKLDYLAGMTRWSAGGRRRPRASILVGDLNIAPLEHDVWSHQQLLNVVSHTPVEVEGMGALQEAGRWHDVMRAFVPPEEKLFTWWSYRARDWRAANRGRRLDHIWTSSDLAGAATSLQVLTEARGWPQPSDHVPVLATFEV
jgi:exodeoxyribonuclease-3